MWRLDTGYYIKTKVAWLSIIFIRLTYDFGSDERCRKNVTTRPVSLNRPALFAAGDAFPEKVRAILIVAALNLRVCHKSHRIVWKGTIKGQRGKGGAINQHQKRIRTPGCIPGLIYASCTRGRGHRHSLMNAQLTLYCEMGFIISRQY